MAVPHRWASLAELAAGVGDGPVDRCIHLGWYADPTDYLTNEAGNADATARSDELVAFLVERGCRRLTVAGTCAEYGEHDRPIREDDPVAPWSAYGRAKAAFHARLVAAPPPGMAVTWARLFNLTGPGEDHRRLVPWVVRSLLAGEPVDLSPGAQVRDYLDVVDVATALVALADTDAVGTFNVCSGGGIALRDLLGGIGARLGREELLGFGRRPYGEHDAPMVVGSSERLRAATGWRPRHDIDAMTDRVVDHWTNAARAERER